MNTGSGAHVGTGGTSTVGGVGTGGGTTVVSGTGGASVSNGSTGGAGVSSSTGGTNGGQGTGGSSVFGGGSGGSGPATGGPGTGGTPVSGGPTPAGYWNYSPTGGAYSWNGCAWTGVDKVTVAPNKSSITPTDFTNQAAGSPYHVKGTVGPDPASGSVALLGFNLAQPAAGASCTYDPATASQMGPPGITFPAGFTGIAVNDTRTGPGFTLRIQIQGPNGATDAMDRWCYTLTAAAGQKDFAPLNMFYTSCWNVGNATMSPGTAYAGQPISAIVFTVPGSPVAVPYEFTVNGFALGTKASDAPDGGQAAGPIAGTIGGPDPTNGNTIDFQRVKVAAGGHSYIVQNNNWGNPTGTDQTISYSGNSFTVSTITGGDLGAGSVRSFPSIYIGANGNTMNGALSTSSDDNLPKQVSAIKSVATSFTWSGGAAGGNYNATYDVWFASQAPAAAPPYYPTYNDGLGGFLMVWLYKPGANNPIGGSPAHSGVTVPGVPGSWNVYIGPRGGGGPNSGVPVVSYVSATTLNTLTFDLNDFIKHAVSSSYGIQNAWYLTDVFAGFEIWNGANAQGLKVNNFTAVVQ